MHYTGVRDGNKAKINLSILVFFPTIYWSLSGCIQNLTLAFIEAEKFVTEIFIGGTEKWTNKGND